MERDAGPIAANQALMVPGPKALTQVTEAESNIPFLWIDLAEEPGVVRIRSKEFHDRKVILVAVCGRSRSTARTVLWPSQGDE
jgi:hypothetical protein